MSRLILLTFLFLLVLPFSFGATLNGSDSIYTFNVTNCQANETVVGCNLSSIRFSCDITNSAFIDFTEFQVDGSLYNASRVGQNWRYDFSKPLQNSTINTTINFTRIYVTDTNSDTAVFDEDNVSVLNDCVTCTDVGYSDPCTVFDNTTFYHVFEPSGCQADFNETVTCNYCSEDLFQTLGDCQVNNTQTVDYSDLNYFSCCAVTGIVSDCSILFSPYNSTSVQNCSYLTTNFSCNIPSNVEFKDRMTFSCLLPDDLDYSCVVNVYEDDRLVQVNPESESYGTGLLSFKRVESREFFTPENRVLNAYFTDKNLLSEDEFVVEVECNYQDTNIVSEQLVTPFYTDLSFIAARGVWGKDNAAFIITGVIFALLITVLLGVMIKNLRGRR